MQFKTIKITLLAASIGLIGGCADMAQLEEAKSMASAAMAKADDAYNLAQNASNLASEASYAAQQAEGTATAALECCNANASKLDRMFEKAMQK
ncbi:MAG: Lpp/OprI family alanine-zipper lipoprotein [Pseudomonadota bacterium]